MKLRSAVADHDDLFCRMCGVIPGDIDDFTGQRGKFHIGRINRLSRNDELLNLRVLCLTCYRGAKELYKERMSDNRLSPSIDLAVQDAQRPILSALLKEIGEAR